MKDWKDYPRKTDKVALVGFHEATRDNAPYFDEEYEIWTLNEEYNYDWVKRTDRHFQLHPRWDYSRTNNLNDPNHFWWLQNKKGPCVLCKGKGEFIMKDGSVVKCQTKGCVDGTYTPFNRKGLPIYMQKADKDVPNSITLPLDEITKKFLPARHYYTSSVAYMLGLAMLMGYKEIELYGFDMGTGTEYHYQRANFEYWVGIAHGKGIKVTLPKSTILTGLLYGYDNMRTGYRQQLELRSFNLNKQFHDIKTKCTRLEAQQELIAGLGAKYPDLRPQYDEITLQLQKHESLLNFINGAKIETENLTKMFEGYMRPTSTEEEINHPAYEDALFVGVQYTVSEDS